MKLSTRALAVTAAVALTLSTPVAAHAGGPGSGKAKGKTAAAQQAKKKADADRKKKAEQARAKFTFPGKVASVSADGLRITRKERGVVVTREFVLDAAAVVKRDGARITLADVQPGDHVVAQGRKVDGVLRVFKLNVESAVAPAPVETATPTATIII